MPECGECTQKGTTKNRPPHVGQGDRCGPACACGGCGPACACGGCGPACACGGCGPACACGGCGLYSACGGCGPYTLMWWVWPQMKHTYIDHVDFFLVLHKVKGHLKIFCSVSWYTGLVMDPVEEGTHDVCDEGNEVECRNQVLLLRNIHVIKALIY